MSAPTIELAAYEIAVCPSPPALVVVARERHAALPENLRCFLAPLAARQTLTFSPANVADDSDAGEITISDAGGRTSVLALAEVDDALRDGPAALKEAMRKCLPAIGGMDDALMRAYNHLSSAFGRVYPNAAVEVRDGLVRVCSDTAYASSAKSAARPGKSGNAPKRPKGGARVDVWL